MQQIVILGGGAAGLAAAVAAAQSAPAGAVRVTVLDRNPRCGKKLLATGNGRCNISNACISADAYRNQAFVEQALMHLQSAYAAERGATSMRTLEANPVLERFADMGLVTREESEGRLPPMANKATSVLDVLRSAAAELGVDVQTDKRALRVDAPADTIAALKAKFPWIQEPPSSDICYASSNRQAAVKLVAQQSDCVVIVGSANSSNSVRLMEVAQEGLGERGKAYRVDDASELDPAWFEGLESVGISSGASVPDELVSGVIDALQNLGFTGMKSVETIKENMHFVLPAELRRKK